MNFIEAVKAATAERKIRRSCWGSGTFCGSVNGEIVYLRRAEKDDGNIMHPVVANFLADDWEIVPDPPKTMTAQEAIALCKSGKKVKRLAWNQLPYEEGIVLNEHARCYSFEDFEATDWVVVKEENK